MEPTVSVTIVTFNSDKFIEPCLRSVLGQTYRIDEVVVVDNGSVDRSRDILAQYKHRVRVIKNDSNTGFAAAQNQAIGCTTSDWVLVLNPDAVLEPYFVEQLMDAASDHPSVGTACGRMLSARDPELLDTAGIYFTPALRHLDRGWHEPDDGRYRRTEYVFGASAAAALYRREMIEDISIDGEFFDSAFFAYREDADVAWRAQLLGWRCMYVPAAKGLHVRSVGPHPRRGVAKPINMHSVKNRFLMRVKNVTPALYRRFWKTMTLRDLMVVGSCLLWEQSSLPAFWHLGRSLPRALRHRRWIMDRRRIADDDLASWFSENPSARAVAQLKVPVHS